MSREIMRRRATDNEYRHPDFHGALSLAIEYLHRRYGEQAVRDYLRRFVRAYYAPLMAELTSRGLPALREHLEQVYGAEGADFRVTQTEDELLLEVAACPALAHMRRRGYPVAELWGETTRTVYAALCEDTPYRCEVLQYDLPTGRSRVRFWRQP